MPDAGEPSVLHELVAAVDAGEPVVLATVVGTCHSVPRHAGSKMLVRPGGRHCGSVGGGAVEARVVADALEVLAAEEPRLVHYDLSGAGPGPGDAGLAPCGGELTVYLEPHIPPPTVLVVGCGHVGRAVADLAHWLGFRVIAADSRAEVVTPDRLPGADLRLAGPVEDVARQVPITAATSIVVTTSSVEADAAALPLLLVSPAGYIGVLGSRRRWQATCRELVARGLPEDALGRVKTPAGLDLGGETPREIALAVMAEIVALRHHGAAGQGRHDRVPAVTGCSP
jgi:xanthine dehydrogenase accessory factor